MTSSLLICILLVCVTSATEVSTNQDICARELFNPAVSSPFFENGTFNYSFIDDHEIDINPTFWNPYYLRTKETFDCDMEYWRSPYNTDNYSCYQILTHHYMKDLRMIYDYTPGEKRFRDTYNSFFDMAWTPDKDDTYIVFTCIHSHSSHCDVLLHISAIYDDMISPVRLATRQIAQSSTIRRLELSDIKLQKNQKYVLTIEIRAIGFYEVVRHRRKHYWFSIIRIDQSCATVKTENPNEINFEESNDGLSVMEMPVYQ